MQLLGLFIFLALLASAIVAAMWYFGTAARRREKGIISSRSGETMETFMASFRPELRQIAGAVYSAFQEFTFTRQVPLRKSDSLAKTLNIDKQDIDDTLSKVARQFGCRPPTKQDDVQFRGRETFEDFVEFIYHLTPDMHSDAGNPISQRHQ